MSDVTKQFGSPEPASQLWAEQGYHFYQRDELGLAIKRFDQGWLLNSRNPEVYAGLGAVQHDRRQYCEAKDVVKQAIELNQPTFKGIYADASRFVTLRGERPNADGGCAREAIG